MITLVSLNTSKSPGRRSDSKFAEAPIFKLVARNAQQSTGRAIGQRMLRNQFARQVEIKISERKVCIDLHGFTGHEVVPGEGIEPTLCYQNRILSPARLPVPPARPNWDADYRLFV